MEKIEIILIILSVLIIGGFLTITQTIKKLVPVFNKEARKKKKAISFKDKYIDIGLPVVSTKILNNQYDFILDTGANFNALDKKKFQEIVKDNNLNIDISKINEETNDIIVTGVGGEQQNIKDVSIELSIEDLNFIETFSLVDIGGALETYSRGAYNLCGVLGAAFFEKHQWQLDFKDLVVLMENKDKSID